MELSMQRELRLVMGQQMYQSLAFLQMSAVEMDDYLRELSMENPLLEEVPAKKPIERRVFSIHSGYVKRHNGECLEMPVPERSHKTITDYLIDQIMTMKLSPQMERAFRYLIINLDERGYLIPEVRESSAWRIDPKLFEQTLLLLRSLEPCGIGADNLSECLCLQLEKKGLKEHPAYQICESYLDHLAKHHFNHIGRKLGITESEVVQAAEVIRTLNPVPSNGFGDQQETVFVVPDVILKIEDGDPILYTSEEYMPSYCVSPFYQQMAVQADLSEEEKHYFREKLETAKWAVNCTRRRKETLLRCAEEIVREQWPFFCEKRGTLSPLTMSETADRLGIHLSTVSRAVKNKYLASQRGVFSLSSFFVSEVNGDTADEIIGEIRKVISEEDRAHPMSDLRICEDLRRRGYEVARRTVAKYREQASIPPATGRKARTVKEA